MRHLRGYGCFSKVIETYAVKEDLFLLEEAMYKMSGLAAETIGLHDRGLIKEGYKADLLLFDPTLIREKATYENPHRLAEGMDLVILNGKIAKEAEIFSEERKGVVLKKESGVDPLSKRFINIIILQRICSLLSSGGTEYPLTG